MSGPFISLSTYPVRSGRADIARAELRRIVGFVEQNEPRVLAFHCYVDDTQREAAIVQVHPDAASMAHHLYVIAQPVAGAGDWLDLGRKAYTVFGDPPPTLRDHWAASATAHQTYPDHLSGFERVARAESPRDAKPGGIMTSPFIYIATYPIREGRLDGALDALRDVARIVEEKEPRVLGFHFYLDADQECAVCVQIHPDAESMAAHMATVAGHIAGAGEWLDLERMTHTTLGIPPQVLVDYWDEFHTERESYPDHVAGFERVTRDAQAVPR